MRRHFDNDPTQFFTVVGAPYVHERRTEAPQPRRFRIGAEAATTILCAAALGFSLFAQTSFAHTGFAKIAEVAHHVVK
jgi:hypothetical protein